MSQRNENLRQTDDRAKRYQQWQERVALARLDRLASTGKPRDEYSIGGPALDFVWDYEKEYGKRRRFVTPGEQKRFTPNSNVVRGRNRMLIRYLYENPELTENAIRFARSILLEIVTKDLLDQVVSPKEADLEVLFAPTDVDRTSRKGPTQNLGGDIIVARSGIHIHGKEYTPLLLIDVATGSGLWKYSTGVNTLLGAPAVSLPMGEVRFAVDGTDMSSGDYLDLVVKPAIALGEYVPFVGVSDESRGQILHSIKRRLYGRCHGLRSSLSQRQEQTALDLSMLAKLGECMELFQD